MKRAAFIMAFLLGPAMALHAQQLQVGFGKADITPKLGKKPVYMAGFGQNRKATGIQDPLYARAVVLQHKSTKVAMVSVDLVGFFYANVQNVRKKLPGFHYVLVSSTHSHEGPDTMGLWGPSPFVSGVDPDYMQRVEAQIVQAVKDAEKSTSPAMATIGAQAAPELIHDGREPYVKHDTIVALRFQSRKKTIGILVQWNCHPETLGSKNTKISTDYVGTTIAHLEKKYQCPVAYFTGTVGGLMTSLHVPIKDKKGQLLQDGTWEKTERFGIEVGRATEKALSRAKPLTLTPLRVHARQIFIPLDNKLYLLGRQLGVLKRPAFLWNGNPYQAKPAPPMELKKRLALRTEVAWLQLGELDVAAIPGEIYPELVLGKIQDPVDPGSDFPKAKPEPAIYSSLPGKHRMIVGLANDEIGYIIPKLQWDQKKPFCYGRKKTQYGEVNSVGPDAAPVLCNAFQKLVKEKKP